MDENLTGTLSGIWTRSVESIADHLPKVIAAVVIALVGWWVARLLRKGVRFLVDRGQQALDRVSWLESRVRSIRLYRTAPAVLSAVVFWIAIVFFAAAAVETLGLPAVSELLGRLTTYLPRVFAAVLILLVGLFAGDFVMGFIVRTMGNMGASYGDFLARTTQVLVISVAVIIGVEQLGIDSTVLTVALAIAFATTLGAAALAFSLGARTTVANMMAIQQIGRDYRVGDRVRVDDHEGQIRELSKTAVIIEGREGRVMIPGQWFSERVSIKLTHDE